MFIDKKSEIIITKQELILHRQPKHPQHLRVLTPPRERNGIRITALIREIWYAHRSEIFEIHDFDTASTDNR